MQWSQIKTLFILCFLILDVYLLFLFLDKQKEADIGVLEHQSTTIEQQLEAENIKYGNLPEAKPDETFLSLRQKIFTDDELGALQKFSNQKATIINGNFIISQLVKPVPVPEKVTEERIMELMANMVVSPNEYEFWDWNEEYNVLLFFQVKNDRPVYFNRNGMILVFLNDKNEITSYTQTMLGDSEDQNEKKSIIKPIKAIEILYQSNKLITGEEVTNIKMGYHTMTPLANGVQVFVPTWKVEINRERNYFVNAIEGFAFGEDSEFVHDTFTRYTEKIQTMTDNKELKDSMLAQLKEKLDAVNRSEEK